MKKHVSIFITVALVLTIVGGISFLLIGPHSASACGYGRSGGGDYVPQRQGSSGYLAGKATITPEQAREIVVNHISKLNPDLEVGNINDAGGFFEAEILSKDKEVIQLLGIDKSSGRLMLLN